MKVYIEKIEYHKIMQWTESPEIAENLGWTITKDSSEIEKSEIDGCWYEKGFAPMQSAEEKLQIARDQKKKEAEHALTAKIAEITPYYPTDEKVSFAKQEEEAKKYLVDPEISENEIPCIAGIAKGRQMELSELVQKIMYKANLFAAASGYYMGLKQRIEDLADRAQTEDEMAAIDVAKIFAEPMQPEPELEIKPEPETNLEPETNPDPEPEQKTTE